MLIAIAVLFIIFILIRGTKGAAGMPPQLFNRGQSHSSLGIILKTPDIQKLNNLAHLIEQISCTHELVST